MKAPKRPKMDNGAPPNFESSMDDSNSKINKSNSGWRYIEIDKACELTLELKDCYLMMLSCMVKFEEYLRRNNDDSLFEMQTTLAKLLLMQSCGKFGLQDVSIRKNCICFKESKGVGLNNAKRGFKFDKESLFDTFIESFITNTDKLTTPRNLTTSKADTTQKHPTAKNGSLRKRSPRKANTQNKEATSREDQDLSISSIENAVADAEFEQIMDNNAALENGKQQSGPKEKKKRKSFASPVTVRRSTRTRATMPLDRIEIIHRNIHRALGKTDDEISMSYLDLTNGKNTKINDTNKNVAEPKNTSTPLRPNKTSKKKISLSKTIENEKISVQNDVVLKTADLEAECPNASSESPRLKESRLSLPEKNSTQVDRDLTPRRRKKIQKLCERVFTLPSNSVIAEKRVNQKRKFVSMSPRAGMPSSSNKSKTGTRKLFSPDSWLERVNRGEL